MKTTTTTNNNLYYGVQMGKIQGRFGKAFEVADLKTISPGVKVNKNYKPGADPALDAVLKKLKENPSGLDSSGMGTHLRVKKKTKMKSKTA